MDLPKLAYQPLEQLPFLNLDDPTLRNVRFLPDSTWIDAKNGLTAHPPLSERDLKLLLSLIATASDSTITPSEPYLSVAPLLIDSVPFRATGFIPPVSRSPWLTLRRLTTTGLSLRNLGLDTALTSYLIGQLSEAGRLIVYGTQGSGKTTLLTLLLAEFVKHHDAPITVLEDASEIYIPPHSNAVGLEATGSTSIEDLIELAMRTGSAHVWLGEIRAAGPLRALLNLWLTGHGGMATFHAGSVTQAARRIALLSDLDPELAREAITLYIQMAGGRLITAHQSNDDGTFRTVLEPSEPCGD